MPCPPPPMVGWGGQSQVNRMQNADNKAKSNVRLAIILGLVAFGFFLMGLYLAMGKGS